MTALNLLYRSVRDFASQTPAWGTAARYHTKPDERFDLTLVSQRVYGNRDHALVVAAAAGLDSMEQELVEQTLVLPTIEQLGVMRVAAGLPAYP
jgi:hypothetical protein